MSTELAEGPLDTLTVSFAIEGVDYPDTGGLEVADVAGDYREAMLKGCGRDEKIDILVANGGR